MTARSTRSSLQRTGASLASLVVGGSAAVAGISGMHAAGASEAPHGSGGDGGEHGPNQGLPASHLQTCTPDVGGVKVPYSTQGFFDPISMTQINQVRSGQTVELKFRIISTELQCVIANTAAVGLVGIVTTSCPTGRPQEHSVNVVSSGEGRRTIGIRFDRENQVFVNTISIPKGVADCFTVNQSAWDDPAGITAGFTTKR